MPARLEDSDLGAAKTPSNACRQLCRIQNIKQPSLEKPPSWVGPATPLALPGNHTLAPASPARHVEVLDT